MVSLGYGSSVEFSEGITSRSTSGKVNGRSTSVSIMPNVATFAPRPSASVTMTTPLASG